MGDLTKLNLTCPICGGTGTLRRKNRRKCRVCNGTGQLPRDHQDFTVSVKGSASTPLVRQYLRERDGDCCNWCNEELDFKSLSPTQDMFPTIDHILSRALGGKNRVSNLVLACRKCNNGRETREFKMILDQIRTVPKLEDADLLTQLISRLDTNRNACLRKARCADNMQRERHLSIKATVYREIIDELCGILHKQNLVNSGLLKEENLI